MSQHEDLSYLDAHTAPAEQEPDAPVGVAALAERLKDLKHELDLVEAQRKTLQARYDEVRKRQLPDALAAAGLTNARLASGGMVYLTTNLQVSPAKEMEAQLLRWLRDNGHASIIKPTVHPATLKAWFKEMREEGRDVPVELLSVFEEPMAAYRAK